MSTLDVPGARLDYRTTGDGPLVVCIPGSRGIGAVYHALAAAMASRYRVLTFDRRGFGASALVGPQDYAVRLRTDAADVARLVRHEGNGPAVVFGNSSGAIVALQVLTDHPEAVRLLLAHEPPALTRLPADETAMQMAASVALHETYVASGLEAAASIFMHRVMTASDRAALVALAALDPERAAANYDHWFQHELRQYPATAFDDARLLAARDRLVFLAGEEAAALFPHRIAVLFAEQLGVPLEVLPGGHVGFAALAPEFAEALCRVLDARLRPASSRTGGQ